MILNEPGLKEVVKFPGLVPFDELNALRCAMPCANV